MPPETAITLVVYIAGLAIHAGIMWAKVSMLEKMVSKLTEKLDEYEQRLRRVEGALSFDEMRGKRAP